MSTETNTTAVDPNDYVVKFDQPEKGKHVYQSTDGVDGYEVKRNDDRKTWTLSGPNGVIGETFGSRQEAFDAASTTVYPDAPKNPQSSGAGNAPATQPKALINARENTVLLALKQAGKAVSINELGKATELDMASVMGTVAALSRRKFLKLTAEGAEFVDLADAALENFRTRPIAERKAAGPRAAAVSKRPEGAPPIPTILELREADLAIAKAALGKSHIIAAMYPSSKHVQPRVDKDMAKIAEIEAEIQRLKDNNLHERTALDLSAYPEKPKKAEKEGEAPAEVAPEAPAEG